MVSAMAASLLAGCSGGGTKPTETTKPGAPSETTEKAAGDTAAQNSDSEEPITIRMVSWQSHQAEANQKVADAYMKLHPNIKVQIDYVGDMNSQEYLTKSDIMLMGGEEMDILLAPGFADYTVRAASGSYLPLDEYFEAEGIEAEDAYNVISRVDGKTYGIPGEMKYNLVLINKDMLDEAGLPVPPLDWTWDDYHEYAKKLTKGSGVDTIYGSHFHTWGNVNLWGVTSAKKGNGFFNDDKTLTFDNPEFRDFIKLRYDMESVDKCSTSLADIKSLNISYRDKFFNGEIAMLPMGTFMLSDIGNEAYSPKSTTTFARQPLWNKDDEHYNVADAITFSIAKTSTHPKEAFDFLRFWTTEGVTIKGMFISNEKGVDKMDSVNQIISGFTAKVDVDALKPIMQDPKWVDSYPEYIPSYQSEIDSILTEETDKYLLGSQSLDDTIAKLMERGNEVIEENK